VFVAQDEFIGFCLRNKKRVIITAPHGVIGALYSCPLCDKITEQGDELEHVIKPSKPLLAYLESKQ
jgi:hypothetical protein